MFGGGSRAPVAIMILVKNPDTTHGGCKIHYRDIGDYLTHKEKLKALREAVSVKGFSDWQMITPNTDYDWVDQRSDAFAEFYPLGSQETRSGNADDAIFRLYSQGLKTGRDAYIHNFSRDSCAENAERMAKDYIDALSEINENPELIADEVARQYTANISWDRELRNNLRRRRSSQFNEDNIRKVAYRPFIKTNCYADYIFIQMKYQMDRIFPNSSSENRVICVPGIGSQKPFSVLMTDTMTDLGFNDGCQCFSRWQYPRLGEGSTTTGTFQNCEEAPERIDNISDTALNAFRNHYRDDTITKDDIFDYVYGVLHAPSYRDQFANDLSKMIPRIPFAPDFRAFAEAGQRLADLHLNYETCEQYPDLKVEPITPSLLWEEKPNIFDSARGQCGSPIKKQKQRSPSTNTSVYPASQKKHIAMSSTAEPHSNGSSTVTKSRKTQTAASSTTQTAGSRTPATSSPP